MRAIAIDSLRPSLRRRAAWVGLTLGLLVHVGPARECAAGYGDCQPSIGAVAGDSLLLLPSSQRILQPIAAASNVSACSLAVRFRTYSWARIDVHMLDPQALAPDPTTVSLRTRRFDPSSMQYFGITNTFSPPVVTIPLSGVADGRAGSPAIELGHNTYYASNALYLLHQVAADPAVPVALIGPAGGTLAPLPGSHPALAQALCGGPGVVADYRVVQCVMTTDEAMPPSGDEFAQHFRVPAPVTMHWAEIANAVNPAAGSGWPVEVTLHEGGPAGPPADLSTPMTRGVTSEIISPYAYHQDHARWLPTFDFDAQVTLLPGRDYWLVVRDAVQWSMLTRVRTGTEGPAFDAAIGPLLRRPDVLGPWIEVPQRSLSFRLIGTPSSVIDAPPPTVPTLVPLRLRVNPVPARGPLRIEWSSEGLAPVRIEVLDVSGRLLGRLPPTVGRSGTLDWTGVLSNGRRLSGGVYLLRASAGSEAPVSQRVVLIR